MSDVFLSYSRANAAFAHKLADELKKRSYDVWVDVVGIPFTSEWWAEIQRGIESADNFVLVMSPDLLGSPVCHLEIEYARKLNKRITPVNHIAVQREAALERIVERIVDDAYITQLLGDRSPIMLFDANWQVLGSINWFSYPYDETAGEEVERQFYETLPHFVEALNVDMVHVRQHTRLLTRAHDWIDNDRDPALLLVGDDVTNAERWLADWEADKAERVAKDHLPKAPQPTDEIREFITASRTAEDERQRQLKEFENSRRRSRILIAAAGLSVIGLLVVLAVTSNQVSEAQGQAATAVAIQGTAEGNAATSVAQAETATYQQGQAEDNAALAETQVSNANSTATQIVPTLTKAAIEQEIAEEFANAILQSDNDPNHVIAQMDTLVERYPMSPSAYLVRGVAYYEQGAYEEAILNFDQALNFDSQYAAAYYNRGNAYYAQQNSDKAIADYTRAIEINSQYAEAYNNRGFAYSEKGDLVNALADFNQAIAFDSQLSNAYYNRGHAYLLLEEWTLAITDFDQAILLNPQDAPAHSDRGYAYRKLGNSGAALTNFTDAISIDPQFAVAFNNRGLVYADLDDWQSAISDYTQAISLDAHLGEAYYNRGQAHLQRHEFYSAAADFGRAADLGIVIAHLDRALVYLIQGNLALALADFEQYERLGGELSSEAQAIRDEAEAQVEMTATATASP